jgi:hypothetical protein
MKDILVVSDIHFADVWNKIVKKLPVGFPFLNPNHIFEKFTNFAKKDDLIVVNGDSVDYHYSNYIPDLLTNWDCFIELFCRQKKNFIFNLGNHDFRLHAYNFDIYGLDHVNISKSVKNKYLSDLGFNKFRFFGELNSIKIRKEKDSIMKKIPFHHEHIIERESSILLLLNTGPDYFNKPLDIFRKHGLRCLMSATSPSSEGLSSSQLAILKRVLNSSNNKEIILFLHNPPFFKIEPFSLDLPIKNYLSLFLKENLSKDCFLTNVNSFIDLILKSKKNIIVITSHTHVSKEFIMDKKKRILRTSSILEINKLRKNKNYIKFVSTLPLGAISRHNKKIGYLKIGKKIEHIIVQNFGLENFNKDF